MQSEVPTLTGAGQPMVAIFKQMAGPDLLFLVLEKIRRQISCLEG